MSAPRMTLADAAARRTPLARVLAVVAHATVTSDGYRARCEVHGPPADRSLRVRCADDGTMVTLACDAGCALELILGTLGLRLRDLRKPAACG